MIPGITRGPRNAWHGGPPHPCGAQRSRRFLVCGCGWVCVSIDDERLVVSVAPLSSKCIIVNDMVQRGAGPRGRGPATPQACSLAQPRVSHNRRLRGVEGLCVYGAGRGGGTLSNMYRRWQGWQVMPTIDVLVRLGETAKLCKCKQKYGNFCRN